MIVVAVVGHQRVPVPGLDYFVAVPLAPLPGALLPGVPESPVPEVPAVLPLGPAPVVPEPGVLAPGLEEELDALPGVVLAVPLGEAE